jgi:hypothetical protein
VFEHLPPVTQTLPDRKRGPAQAQGPAIFLYQALSRAVPPSGVCPGYGMLSPEFEEQIETLFVWTNTFGTEYH